MDSYIDRLPKLTIGVDWVDVLVLSEPYVVYTSLGYTVVVEVSTESSDSPQELIIGSKSMTVGLEVLRKENSGKFLGMRFKVSKESSERTSKYQIKGVDEDKPELDDKAIPGGKAAKAKRWCPKCNFVRIYNRDPSDGSWCCEACGNTEL